MTEPIADLTWPLWTRQQVAEVCMVTTDTVKNWEKAGFITRVNFGSQLVRYPSKQVCEFILSHTVFSKVPPAARPFLPAKLDPQQLEELYRRLERMVGVLCGFRVNPETNQEAA